MTIRPKNYCNICLFHHASEYPPSIYLPISSCFIVQYIFLLFQLTHHDIPSRYYTSAFFGIMVKLNPSVSAVSPTFLDVLFFLFGGPDSAFWTQLNGVCLKAFCKLHHIQSKMESYATHLSLWRAAICGTTLERGRSQTWGRKKLFWLDEQKSTEPQPSLSNTIVHWSSFSVTL